MRITAKKITRFFIFVFALFAISNSAYACCQCLTTAGAMSKVQWQTTTKELIKHVDDEFVAQEKWMINVLFEDNILPAMMLMTEQFTIVAMQQAHIFGSFFDAKHQLETQRIFQKLQARAHKDYRPSVGMCEFGSSIRSLAQSERKGEVNAVVMSQRSLDRQLGATNTVSALGNGYDRAARIEQYKTTYCDPWDQGSGLWIMCRGQASRGHASPSSGSATQRQRFNKDVDYGRTIDMPWTLDVDFADAGLTEDEEDVLALGTYLYSHHVFSGIDPENLGTPPTNKMDADITDAQKAYLDMLSYVAKSNVAENSYNAIVGLKSAGDPSARDIHVALLQDLGITDINEINRLLGTNTSYYGQMEVMTKKAYQNPTFYTNLYDSPANVDRKAAALLAISLMQKFDTLKSYLRSEASMSVLLELALLDLQDQTESRIARKE